MSYYGHSRGPMVIIRPKLSTSVLDCHFDQLVVLVYICAKPQLLPCHRGSRSTKLQPLPFSRCSTSPTPQLIPLMQLLVAHRFGMLVIPKNRCLRECVLVSFAYTSGWIIIH